MNIVFFLSQAVDLRPLSSQPIPLELFPFQKNDIFSSTLSRWQEEFPDDEFFVIDPGETSVFYRLEKDINTLSLPGADPYSALFIYSAFILSQEWDTQTLFLPMNMLWEDIPELVDMIRSLQKNELTGSTLIQFAASQPNPYVQIVEQGPLLYQQDDFSLYEKGQEISFFQYREKVEKEPEYQALALIPQFLFNAMRFMEWVSSWGPDVSDLFYLLSDAFRSGEASASLLREVILKLKEWDFNRIITSLPEHMVLPVDFYFESFNNFREFLEILPRDEEGNFISGKAELINCSNCVVINKDERSLLLENQHQNIILQSPQHIRIFRLS